MEIKELVPEKIWTISNFLSSVECAEYIALSEEIGYNEAPINTERGSEVRSDVRNNSRAMLDSPEKAEKLWQRLAVFVPAKMQEYFAAGLNERLRFYRYDLGQKFSWHYDGAYRRNSRELSAITFMVYLNENFVGGNTQFDLHYPDGDLVVTPKTGMSLCFIHRLLHQGNPVIQGTKYVLRSDIMYSKYSR